MVCCYLVHIQHLPSAEEALAFYSVARTNNKKASVVFVNATSKLKIVNGRSKKVHFLEKLIQSRV